MKSPAVGALDAAMIERIILLNERLETTGLAPGETVEEALAQAIIPVVAERLAARYGEARSEVMAPAIARTIVAHWNGNEAARAILGR